MKLIWPRYFFAVARLISFYLLLYFEDPFTDDTMQTLYEVTSQTLNNRTISFTNRTAQLASGSCVLFRLRVTDVRAGARLLVSVSVTFPNGMVKQFDLTIDAVGSYQRGGWTGLERSGIVSASGSVTAEGRVTLDASVVSFDRGEDVPEWS